MKFLVDNQLPPALARMIVAELGAEAIHVSDIGSRDASDAALWNFAIQHEFILISKDEDFARIALIDAKGGLLWVRLGNCRKCTLLRVFRELWPEILNRLQSGDKLIELR